MTPIVSKLFCSSSQTTLMVRKRPHVTSGGGLVVMSIGQKVLFSVDGCGILGAKGQLVIRDGDGAPILFIKKMGGIVQAMSPNRKWNGYLMDYDGSGGSSVFSLKEPKPCFGRNSSVRISTDRSGKAWDYEVKGSFAAKSCAIVDRGGSLVAQVGVKGEFQTTATNDLYHVLVQPGHDQAFIVGVIAVLDNIHGESTRC